MRASVGATVAVTDDTVAVPPRTHIPATHVPTTHVSTTHSPAA
ncbi:hypothetical protein [Streptomyces sp. NPDC001508]